MMYTVIKHNNTHMEFLNTTRKLKTAINLAYTYASKSYKDVIHYQCNYHQEKDILSFPYVMIYMENNRKPESYIYAVSQIPDIEKQEDSDFNYEPEELFGEEFDGVEFQLLWENESNESDDDTEIESLNDDSSEDELDELAEIFGETSDDFEECLYCEGECKEDSETESDDMEDILYYI